MSVNTDFANLLNNCLNRIDRTDDDKAETKTFDDDSGGFTESLGTSSSNSNSPVRPEIKDIINEKIKQKDDDAGSPEVDKVNPIKIDANGIEEHRKQASEDAPEKAKILFSLKDFFERSSENEKSEDSSKEEKPSDEEDSSDGEDLLEDSDNESDEDKSDLEVKKTKSNKISDSESDVEDAKGDDPDQDSDLESELNILEKLKEKLDNSIIESTKNEDNEVDRETSTRVEEGIEVDENIESGNDKEETEAVKDDKKSPSEKGKESDGSNSDPINIEEDTEAKETKDEASKLREARSIFKNISISVVGGRNINLESFLTAKPPAAAPKPTQNIFPTGPNISIKRKSATSPTNVYDGKRARKSTVIVSSSDEDSAKKKCVPTVTLDENDTIGEISEDDEDPKPKENLAEQYDNCTHGDLTDYMCVDCTYNRWRCEWDFVRPRRVKKAKKTVTVKVNPTELMQAVNWEKVFKFAGVGVEEEIKIE